MQQRYTPPDLSHITCYTCNKTGHYASSCTEPKSSSLNNQLPKLKLTGPNALPVQKVQENRVKRDHEIDHTPKTSRPAESHRLKNSERRVEDNPLSAFCNEGEGNDAMFFNLKCTRNGEPVKTVTNNSLVTLTEAINFFCELMGCSDYKRESNDQFASLSALGRNHLLVGIVLGKPVKALIDTGAQASVIGVEFLFKLIKEGKTCIIMQTQVLPYIRQQATNYVISVKL